MKSALQVMLTTRNGIIVFMAHVMTLDATAAYPNHMGHSVCLRNSISFPCLDRRPPPPLGLPQTLGCGDQRGSTNTASIDRDKCHFAQGPRLKIVYFLMPAFPVSFGNEYPGGQRVDRRDAGPLIEAPGIALSLNNFTFAPNEPINVTIIPDSRTQGDFRNTSDNTRRSAERKRFVRYQEQPVVYRGPHIRVIRSTLSAPADLGAYRVTFTGSHETSPRTAAAFVIRKASTGRQLEKIRYR